MSDRRCTTTRSSIQKLWSLKIVQYHINPCMVLARGPPPAQAFITIVIMTVRSGRAGAGARGRGPTTPMARCISPQPPRGTPMARQSHAHTCSGVVCVNAMCLHYSPYSSVLYTRVPSPRQRRAPSHLYGTCGTRCYRSRTLAWGIRGGSQCNSPESDSPKLHKFP